MVRCYVLSQSIHTTRVCVGSEAVIHVIRQHLRRRVCTQHGRHHQERINSVFCHSFANECHVILWDSLLPVFTIFSSNTATATSMLVLILFERNFSSRSCRGGFAVDSRWAHSCCGAPREEPLQLPAPSFLGACALRVSASAAKLSAGRRHRSLRRCPLSTDPRRWGRPQGARPPSGHAPHEKCLLR